MSIPRLRRKVWPLKAGQTMLELVAATTIMSIALIPALRLTRDTVINMEVIERDEMRISLCVSKLEEELAKTAATWNLSPQTGSFGSWGRPELRFLVNKSDTLASGGIPGFLAAIDVTVWYDADAGGDLDPTESRTQFSIKVARLVSYENEATIH